jgi:hypothetical protein
LKPTGKNSILRREQVADTRPLLKYGRLSVDPTENGGDGSDRRLHCEDGAEPGLAVRNAFVGLGGLR